MWPFYSKIFYNVIPILSRPHTSSIYIQALLVRSENLEKLSIKPNDKLFKPTTDTFVTYDTGLSNLPDTNTICVEN